MDDTNERKVDLLAEAGELMRRFAKGEAISGTLYHDRNAAIVLASAILAVAGELRDIHNMLLHEINQHAGALLARESTEPLIAGSSRCEYCDGTGEWIPAPGYVASCPKCGGRTITPIYYSTLKKTA